MDVQGRGEECRARGQPTRLTVVISAGGLQQNAQDDRDSFKKDLEAVLCLTALMYNARWD